MSSMRTALMVVALAAVATEGLMAQTVTAFKTGERTTGMTKQCYYKFGVNEYTRTIRAVALCPLSIRVRIASPPSPRPRPILRPPSPPPLLLQT